MPIPGGVRQSLFGWAAKKVAGGVGVGHRVGVVEVEDQGKVERVGAGGQGFVQDAVTPDVFEAPTAGMAKISDLRGGGEKCTSLAH
jgi:hypothetical protein